MMHKDIICSQPLSSGEGVTKLQTSYIPNGITPAVHRRTTDKFGLICFLILLLAWICFWIYAIYMIYDSSSPCGYINGHMINTSWKKISRMNASSDAVHNLFLSINSTIRILNSSELFSDLYSWHAVNFTRSSILLYFGAQYVLSMTKICFKYNHSETVVHFVIISIGKAIITSIFAMWFFLRYSHELHDWPYLQILILFIPEYFTYISCLTLVMGHMSSNSYRPKFINNLRSLLRYYTKCRYLIFLRILILIFTILLVLSNIMLFKHLSTKKHVRFDALFFIHVGSIHMIFFLNNFGKMVVMTASSYHNWSTNNKAIPFNRLLSSVFIIGRYHVGTVFLHTIFLRRLYTLQNKDKLPHPDVIIQHFGNDTDIVLHTLERSTILTAVRGQNFEESTTDMLSLEVERTIIFKIESMSSSVWKSMSSSSNIALVMVSVLALPNVENLFSKLITVAVFFAIKGIYNYVITTMDIIDFTKEFCNMESERKNAVIDRQKQPEATI